MIKAKKGVALLWAMIMVGIITIISFTITNSLIKESSFSVNTSNSEDSYNAAQSGIEYAIGKLSKQSTSKGFCDYDTSIEQDELEKLKKITTASNNIIKIQKNNILDSCYYKIESSAEVGKTLRKITYIFEKGDVYDVTGIDAQNNLLPQENYESFAIKTKFWSISNPSSPVNFGLKNSTSQFTSPNENALYVSYNPLNNSFKLKVKSGSEIIESQELLISSTFDPSQMFAYEIDISYIKDTLANLKISTRNQDTGNFDCIKTTSINLGGKNLGNLQYFGFDGTNFVAEEISGFNVLSVDGNYHFDQQLFYKL